MTVAGLIAKLKEMPQDAQVKHVWDGAARTTIEVVWVSRSGAVVTADWGMYVSGDEDFPINMRHLKDGDWFSIENPFPDEEP